jgi:hypothetical protein
VQPNKNVFRSADFPEKANRHNTIAVLPFNIVQTGPKAKNISESDIRDTNKKLSYAFQESLQAHLLKYTSRNRKGEVISFESIQKINAVLEENDLDPEKIYNVNLKILQNSLVLMLFL